MSNKDELLPKSAEELTAMVVDAAGADQTIEVIGSGTKSGIGHEFDADVKIKIAELSGIIEYTHSELVMTTKAGTRLDDVQAELEKNNQMLVFEPADYSELLAASGKQTMGGIFATNLSGPRRLTAGAARDGLLGVNFVNGKGELIKSGGKVMKNVTGLDLVKLLAGSWGTLGIISDMTFKVLPRPEATKTILISGLSDKAGSAAMALAMAQSTEVSSAAHLPEGVCHSLLEGNLPQGSVTALRLEGLEASVDDRKARLISALSGYEQLSVIDTEQSKNLWREISNVKPFCGSDSIVWKVSVAPSAGHQLVSLLQNQCDVNAYYDWQGGLVWLSMDSDAQARTHAILIRDSIKQLGGGHATLIRAGSDIRKEVAVFEPQSLPVATLSARIKSQIDPKNTLNPGRMSFTDIATTKAAV